MPTILLLQALFWHHGRLIENTQLGNRLPAAMASASTRTAWKDDAEAHNTGEGVIHGPGHDTRIDTRIIEGNRLLHQPWRAQRRINRELNEPRLKRRWVRRQQKQWNPARSISRRCNTI
jgi:hypothetical protein